MKRTAEYYIRKLGLLPHTEGGYYKEIYRSAGVIKPECLPEEYRSQRNFCTLIYFLIKEDNISALHRMKSDEIWHFYQGCSVKIICIDQSRKLREFILGSNLEKGEKFQIVIPKNSWFGAELADKNSYALIGCTVSPGFEFEDFEMGNRKELLMMFPEFENEIKRLTGSGD